MIERDRRAPTRRIAMELAGLSRDPDPTLVRHIYDLHLMQGHIDNSQVTALAHEIAAADAKEFRNPQAYRMRYDNFVTAMAYGDRPEFAAAMATVVELAEAAWRF